MAAVPDGAHKCCNCGAPATSYHQGFDVWVCLDRTCLVIDGEDISQHCMSHDRDVVMWYANQVRAANVV